MSSTWVGLDPKSNDVSLLKTEENKTNPQARPCEDRGRHWSYAAGNQGVPEDTRSLEETGIILP